MSCHYRLPGEARSGFASNSLYPASLKTAWHHLSFAVPRSAPGKHIAQDRTYGSGMTVPFCNVLKTAAPNASSCVYDSLRGTQAGFGKSKHRTGGKMSFWSRILVAVLLFAGAMTLINRETRGFTDALAANAYSFVVGTPVPLPLERPPFLARADLNDCLSGVGDAEGG